MQDLSRRGLSQVAAIDDAVPADVVRELRTQIIRAHANRAGARDAGTHWYSLAAPARLLIEQVIQHLRQYVPRGHQVVGAEWWTRATTTDAEFPFHFDRDEGIRSSIVSPALASILYLSNAGGPTVIFNATPSRTSAPTAGVAIHPRPARFGMFPGTLLHGVLPGRPSRWPRITMLVNWWTSVPLMECATQRHMSTRAFEHWRGGVDRTERPRAALEPVDPSRLMAKAAWRDLIVNQVTYR